ncbi:MAG TPA: LUD domain-containing protein [Candidatus Deferrimicrobium sp.]|nr:LUD domain-containing protein [Candidatus Deferrimicrobium sp.]
MAEKIFEEVLDKVQRGINGIKDLQVTFSVGYSGKIMKNQRLNPLKPEFIELKKEIVKNLDKLVDQTIKNLSDKFWKVYLAKTREDAINYILKEVEGEKMIVKSKTNTGKEIELSEKIEAKGIEIVETDIGDRIIQISKQKPSLPIGPAVHLDPAYIAEVFSKYYNVPVKPDPREIVKVGREKLREQILAANVGITGANVVVMEEGSIGLVENEGNISLITRLPRKHIAIAGIDKIVPSWKDAITVLRVMEATFDLRGAYCSFIKGPSGTADIRGLEILGMHGAQETHLVLVDDYRTKALNEGFEELLYCINCGRCLIACPIIHHAGIEIFLSEVSTGPIGLVKAALIKGINTAVAIGLYLCTGCNRCKELCPADIDIPKMIEVLREKAIKNGLILPEHQKMLESIQKYNNPFQKPIKKGLKIS